MNSELVHALLPKLQTEAFALERGHAAIAAYQRYMQANPDAEGACALAALTAVFGPELVAPSEGNFQETNALLQKVETLRRNLQFHLIVPASAEDFAGLMHLPTTIGALIFLKGNQGHVVGLAPYGPEGHFGWNHLKVDNYQWSVLTDYGLSELWRNSFRPQKNGLPVHLHPVFSFLVP